MAGAVRAAEGMHQQVRWHWARGVQVWQEIQRLCFLHHVTNAFSLHTNATTPRPTTPAAHLPAAASGWLR